MAKRLSDMRKRMKVSDPMPRRIEPCLALLVPKPPAAADWSFEIKWDGYRLAVHVEPDGVRVLTRGARLDAKIHTHCRRCAATRPRYNDP